MSFSVYFHKDFDGVCSAALFSEILESFSFCSRGEIALIGVDYDIKSEWRSRSLSSPNAVLDFLFHPEANWWFDHHASTFPDKRAKRKYRQTGLKYLGSRLQVLSNSYTTAL